MSDKQKLTTTAGCPVVDNQNVITAGPRGPQLQDVCCLHRQVSAAAALRQFVLLAGIGTIAFFSFGH